MESVWLISVFGFILLFVLVQKEITYHSATPKLCIFHHHRHISLALVV